MKKYRIKHGSLHSWGVSPHIEVVDVERETEKSVWVDGIRSAKRCDYDQYLDTWEKAKEVLLLRQQSHVRNFESKFKHAMKVLMEIEKMENTDE